MVGADERVVRVRIAHRARVGSRAHSVEHRDSFVPLPAALVHAEHNIPRHLLRTNPEDYASEIRGNTWKYPNNHMEFAGQLKQTINDKYFNDKETVFIIDKDI